MLHEMVRLSTQHRALHCYVLLSLWIFLLVAGVYKFLEPVQKPRAFELPRIESMQAYRGGPKTRRIFKSCTGPEELQPGAEGWPRPPHWTLKGVVVVVRHGDRGPLQHVRNISAVDCGAVDRLLPVYEAHVRNMSLSGRTLWTQPGAFHGFPVLPTSARQCALGQLTMRGVAQLLRTGQLLATAYGRALRLAEATAADVAVYCTRYRRTFQSALALLWPLLPTDLFGRVAVRESPSMSFCFGDCACAAAERHARLQRAQAAEQLRLHPAVGRLVKRAAELTLERPEAAPAADPQALRDALLAYVCHDAALPCVGGSCLRPDHVSALFAYSEWQAQRRARSAHWRTACQLRAYGLFKSAVAHMLRMASDAGPRLVVYSGHDHTLQYLGAALGVAPHHVGPQYASRLLLEVYRDEAAAQDGLFFRALANGRDVTRTLPFCRAPQQPQQPQPPPPFCRIEHIVRYVHDDYFVRLNATNFKDACAVAPP